MPSPILHPSASVSKDPGAERAYGFDWRAELHPVGAVLLSSTWDVPAGLLKSTEGHTAAESWVLLRGGTEGQTYDAVNTVTWQAGGVTITEVRTIQLTITRQ